MKIFSGTEIIKILCKQGFSIRRQSGSHVILSKQTSSGKVTVVVPKHKEIAIGTLKSIIEQSRVSKEYFVE